MIHLIQNDYDTPFVVYLKTSGRTIPLVGSEVYFELVSKATSQRVGGGLCEILDPASGMVKYTFQKGELAQVGEYQGRFRAELTQGARREGLTLELAIVEKPGG